MRLFKALWFAQAVLSQWTDIVPTIKNSSAPDPQEHCVGYIANNVVTVPGVGFTATLDLVVDGDKEDGRSSCNIYGIDIWQLGLAVEYQSSKRVAVKISPLNLKSDNVSFYELPEDALPQGHIDFDAGPDNNELVFEYYNDPSFWFQISRRSSGEVIFSTEGSHLIFENQFIEFKTTLPQNHNLFGLGETIDDFRVRPGTSRTLYNADIPDLVGANLYGSHPFYLEDRPKRSHGVYFRNAHPQEVLVEDDFLKWRAIGGSIELYFFSGPSPKDVIKQYQHVIGYPAMQQYWTLGFHQCRWGYDTVEEFTSMVENHREAGIPVETFWSDLDYMYKNRDFTVDPVRYPASEFKALLDELHSRGQQYVPLVDAAINVADDDDNYNTYHSGVKSNIFVKTPDGEVPFVGEVWPGRCVFPDFMSFNISYWWANQLSDFHQTVPFDGLWLDMNEVSSFCTGKGTSCEKNEGEIFRLESPENHDPNLRNVEHPPYAINNSATPNILGGRTMPPSSRHINNILEYDWHNLYGYDEARATYYALAAEVLEAKRPFLISRSTFAGSGAYTGHWGGDNYSKWPYLKYSISQGLSFSLFGIPMFGTDTCGFIGDASEELCNRWAQLNAFFSFYRNHNDLKGSPQEFYVWPSVKDAAKTAINIRYWLLPYMYTILYNASNRGDTFLRALSWEFPNDESLIGLDTQFLVGNAIMVAPVLSPDTDKINVVFPEESNWYDWYTQEEVKNTGEPFDAPLGHIPLFIRGGTILPLQEPGYTTRECRQGDWTLLIALDDNSEASGELYLDDGESILQEKSSQTVFSLYRNILRSTKIGNFVEPNKLAQIQILGVGSTSPSTVEFNSKEVQFDHDSERGILTVQLENDYPVTPSNDDQTVLKAETTTDWLDDLVLEWKY